MSGHIAAQVARDAYTGGMTPMFRKLSGQMCWDAVVTCQKEAGRRDPGEITINNHGQVISTDDGAVTSIGEMQRVPQGSFVGFFDAGRLVHAMIAVGAGCAAGNKNACIGIGNPIGWEILDLSKLDWSNVGNRNLTVHYRPM